MKEVESQSRWVGKILTCDSHNRSFIVEQGDEIKPGFHRMSARCDIKLPARFELPYGCYFPIIRIL